MILVDYFTEAVCKGTELIEGWYWYEDDSDAVGGPYIDEDAAMAAAALNDQWGKKQGELAESR
jgi:hypothetical protein